MAKVVKKPKEEQQDVTPGYYVAEGKSIATMGFNLKSGQKVKAGHFMNGQDGLDAAIKGGVVVKK